MASKLVYSTESTGPYRPVKRALCRHGKDAGQTCYPCDMDDMEWLDRNYTGGPDEDLGFREDAEMEHWLWFGTSENPIL